jgi:predicted MFS family arabinose efflux permease
MTGTHKTVLLTMAVFALEPLPFGAWLALIPFVKEQLALNKAQLAIALLGMPIGVIPSLQVAGWLMTGVGPPRGRAAAFPAQALVICLPLLATGLISLFLALVATGCIVAMLQVGLNVYAGRLEKQHQVTVMSRCHGFWALGVMVGSLLMAVMADAPPLLAVAYISVPSAALGVWAALSLERLTGQEGGTSAKRRPLAALPPRLALIALCTLAASMTEGAMSDWAAIYLAERLPDGATHAGSAVSIFAGCLAAGRFLGDWGKIRLGVVTLARFALGLAVVGLLVLIVPLPLWTSYIGFALTGLGVSVGFPLGVSAAAGLDDTHEGANIAIVSTVTMLGFLVGPPLIGTLAEAFTLRTGLAALLPGLLAGIFLARALKPV